MKKPRKEGVPGDDTDGIREADAMLLRKKSKKQLEEESMSATKKQKSSKAEKQSEQVLEPAPSGRIHLDALRSIFSTKDETDETFTLFGGEPLSQQTRGGQSTSSQGFETTLPEDNHRVPLFFFPHYDSWKKNAQSLFPKSNEPFYYNRTPYTLLLLVSDS